MPNMAFALDALYAAGWWPRDGDDCLKGSDGRWHPSPDSILSSFAHQRVDLEISMPLCGHPVTVRWHTPSAGSQTVTARTQTTALLLAFSCAFKADSADLAQTLA